MNEKTIVLKLANNSVLKKDHQAALYNRKSQTTALMYCSAAEGMCEILTISGCLPQVPSSDS